MQGRNTRLRDTPENLRAELERMRRELPANQYASASTRIVRALEKAPSRPRYAKT
jgi:hypothetical protein